VQAAIRNQTRLAMAVSGLVLLFGSAIGVFGARTISRPIADLTDMTRRLAGGDFTQRIDIRAKNEIGVLAASFNGMTRRLAESIEHLKETTAAKERIESELKIAHVVLMTMGKEHKDRPTGRCQGGAHSLADPFGGIRNRRRATRGFCYRMLFPS
jgi:methyl-accepting chemotaxis protein